MKFLNKSLVGRGFFYLFLPLLFLGLFGIYAFFSEKRVLPIYFVGIICGAYILYALIIYYFEITRPFAIILLQMKALLTGRKYKKIYTVRKDEVGVLAHFFNEATTALEKVSAEIKEGKRVSGELRLAGELQHELLPNKSPQVKGLDVAVKNRSAEELGGDNFDVINAQNYTYFYLGDVTGHGVPAAIIMTMVNTLINAFIEIYDNAYDVVVQTNRRLKTRIRSTFFMSMIMLKWDSIANKMTYVGCGHEHLIIYRAAKGSCDVKITGGIALGMIPDNSKIVKELELTLEKDDIIVLYTDGITEAKNMEGEMFGLKRLQATIELYAALYDAEGLLYHIARDFSRFVGEHIQEDDATLIAIKIGENSGDKTEKVISWADDDIHTDEEEHAVTQDVLN